ncbi:MAG: hypothetical protein GWP56_13825 [Gammaproteobacteria bacterium]|jgi:tetratricopeptide (TPR) repeat protein|nr:hypothetical protein [Gammaproteobacteria bacterium]
MAAGAARKSPAGKSRYLVAALLLILVVSIGGFLLNAWMTQPSSIPISVGTGREDASNELDRIFSAAVWHMQQGQNQQALDLWHRALLINPDIPDVKVNMGFTLFELGEYITARDFFIDAMEQNAYQANAYYGLAITSEKMGDIEGALGAMRSFLHLAAGSAQQEKFMRRARAALWEWEAQLAAKSSPPGSASENTASPAQ